MSFNVGPQPLNFGAQKGSFSNKATLLIGDIMSLTIWIFLCAYTIPEDDYRSILLMVFQLFMQGLLMALMEVHNLYNNADSDQTTLYNAIHSTSGHVDATSEILGLTGSLTLALVLPVLLEAAGEAQLDSSS